MSDNGNKSISYTRKRTTTKTRNAASSARRRKNIPLCHASGGGEDDGKDRNSWFARKSAGWTDEEIKSHLVSGGVSKGGASFSMVGDIILGDGPKKEKKRKTKRHGGPKFAWEEEEDDGQDDSEYNVNEKMAAAPTLLDIMDDQDKIDFMAPLKVGKQYQIQMKESIDSNDDHQNDKNKSKTKLRYQNAALAELAQVSGVDHGGGRKPTSANESIGLRLLKVCGYRSRLGMAFVPLSGHVGGKDSLDNEVKELEQEGKATHEAKWLASKRLRAIHLPSIQNIDPNNTTQTMSKKKVLTIPPPKINRHGIGFDPFKNAPEFREFHERRLALAQKRGRGTDDATEAEGGKRGDRYFTDDLKGGRQHLWNKDHDDGKDSDDMSDTDIHDSKAKSQQHSHYAADRNYSDFIGTKASSGFALMDEDDANVYQDEEGHSFPRGDEGQGGDGVSQYAMEVQSPLASEEEDNALDDGLFGKSAMLGSRRKVAEKRVRANKPEDKGKIADAWSAWGMGAGSENSATMKTTTMDGKSALPGFTLSQSNTIASHQNKPNATKRWKGPILPSGYILKRHVFQTEDENAVKAGVVDRTDSGLGLDLQRRQRPSRSIPKVLSPSSGKQNQPRSEKMLAKDGSELNFHAVQSGLKSRFVSSAGTSDAQKSATANNDDDNNTQNIGKEEWVQVTGIPWVPTRLLCKRWGVPVPSTAGMSATGEGSTGGKLQSKEENYFRQAIYEPAVAAQRQKGEDVLKGSNGRKDAMSTSVNVGHRIDHGIILGEEDDTGPPPVRPSNDIFQAIFDAESDMDISSSDDDDDELERDGLHTATQTEKDIEDSAPNDADNQMNNSNGTAPNEGIADTNTKHQPQIQMDNDDASSADGSVSSSSQSSKQRRKRRRHHRRSRDDGDYTDEDRKKRKRKEKHRRKHHRRRRDSANESDEKSNGYDSDNHSRKRNKKHKHRSHSRHKNIKK
mmetsp:Transcript_28569/g.51634  ORF Transcript_28569/g.51634 Transcript_28569/m.51634 type:complete len:960 (-) Transcript_28569:986-3865(-)|eukprot:CAMPEP_0201922450 /NCGR_PEP_ID=MMETSP0903-20130614/10480_1 /ASSEMBLY_ACC=CAM_ASM_000552 /TAXON_ID=420261 /ORGANISM="Thalassiosira antarctica, Strain CCMP982" /LENGTH=959 /DNA_ID=CAMNT_0048459593 /DNA_START=35 /DNA_END=2914 /DNA_ORIENTATION=+